jgi:hypothetical protein
MGSGDDRCWRGAQTIGDERLREEQTSGDERLREEQTRVVLASRPPPPWLRASLGNGSLG